MKSLLVKYDWGKEWVPMSNDCLNVLKEDSEVEWIVDSETDELVYMRD